MTRLISSIRVGGRLAIHYLARAIQLVRGFIIDPANNRGISPQNLISGDMAAIKDQEQEDRQPFDLTQDPAQMAERLQKQEQHIQQLKQDLERQTALSAELRHSHDLLQRYSNHLQNQLEEDRTRLAQEIHDVLGQALTGLKMDLYQINKQLNPDQLSNRQRIITAMKLIDQTIVVMRRICTELRPGILDDLGLIAALEWLFNKFQEQTAVEIVLTLEPTDIDIPAGLHTGLFRIVQEILTNILPYTQASQAWVSFAHQNGCIEMDVRDNGNGYEPQNLVPERSIGLTGIHERARHLGGKAIIFYQPDSGIQVRVIVPVEGSPTGQPDIVYNH